MPWASGQGSIAGGGTAAASHSPSYLCNASRGEIEPLDGGTRAL
jgi:hypothetical protein